MTNPDLPDCVALAPKSTGDPEYLVNEYLIRNGYFEDIQSIREENRQLKRDRTAMEREIQSLRKSLHLLDVCDSFHRIYEYI